MGMNSLVGNEVLDSSAGVEGEQNGLCSFAEEDKEPGEFDVSSAVVQTKLEMLWMQGGYIMPAVDVEVDCAALAKMVLVAVVKNLTVQEGDSGPNLASIQEQKIEEALKLLLLAVVTLEEADMLN